jgi:NADPH:quinone reductase-like Zn-dependent oxidoreductase
MIVSIVTERRHGQETATALRLTRGWNIDDLSFDTIPAPSPAPGQVLVKIKAASLNYRDLVVVKGVYAPDLPKPRVLGSDGAGEVFSVGEGVSRFKVGDRVAGAFFQDWVDGPYLDRYDRSSLGGPALDGVLTNARVFHESGLVHIPEHLSYEEASTLPCAALTAWHALVSTAHLRSGQSVLILGTGGVSIFGLQFAKLHGARVVITSSSDEKLARAKSLGADDVVNYRKNPDWEKEVLRLTDGEGVDLVLETAGSGTLDRSVAAVRSNGQISLLGVLTGVNEPLNIRPIITRNIRLQGIFVGSVAMFKEMNRAIAANGLKPVIDHTFPFEQSREALRHLESAKHFGKIVIRLE